MFDVVNGRPGIGDAGAVRGSGSAQTPGKGETSISFRRAAMQPDEQFGMAAQPAHLGANGNLAARGNGASEWLRKNPVGLIVAPGGGAHVQTLGACERIVLQKKEKG